jgi:hypothetical protein
MQTFKTYSVSDIDEAPESPGLYAWYLQLRNEDAFMDYHGVFKARNLETEARGDLLEKYTGDLSLEQVEFEMVSDFGLLKSATAAFSPPLYIGITVDRTLKERLEEHRDVLNSAIYGEISDPGEFGERIAEVLKKGGNIGLNGFFARVLPVPEPRNRRQIEEVEYYLNRTYVPLYGKK